VLAGYDLEKRMLVWKLFGVLEKLPSPIKHFIFSLGKVRKLLNTNQLDINSTLIDNIIKSEPNISRSFTPKEIKDNFGLDYVNYDKAKCDLGEWKNNQYDHILSYVQKGLCKSWLVENLLMRSDKVSMQSSLEMRVPFLEGQFGNWCINLAHSDKIRFDFKSMGYKNKYLLRRYCEKRGFGRIVNRPKQGFSLPVYTWVNTRLKNWIFDELLNDKCKLAEIIGKNKFKNFIGSFDTTLIIDQHKIWNLIILELWIIQNSYA